MSSGGLDGGVSPARGRAPFNSVFVRERLRSRGYLALYPDEGERPSVSLKESSLSWRDARRRRNNVGKERGEAAAMPQSSKPSDDASSPGNYLGVKGNGKVLLPLSRIHATVAQTKFDGDDDFLNRAVELCIFGEWRGGKKQRQQRLSQNKERCDFDLSLPPLTAVSKEHGSDRPSNLACFPVASHPEQKVSGNRGSGNRLNVDFVYSQGVALDINGQARLKHRRTLRLDEMWPVDLPPLNPLRLNLRGWSVRPGSPTPYPLMPMLSRARMNRYGYESENVDYGEPLLRSRNKLPQQVVMERMIKPLSDSEAKHDPSSSSLPRHCWSPCKFTKQGLDFTWSQVWSPEDGSMLSRMVLWRAARLISRTFCIITIWGMGITGRVVVGGREAWPRRIDIEVYCMESCQTHRMQLRKHELQSLFTDGDAIDLVPGRKRELLSSLAKMLRFDYRIGHYATAAKSVTNPGSAGSSAMSLLEDAYSGAEKWACLDARGVSGVFKCHLPLKYDESLPLSVPHDVRKSLECNGKGREEIVLVHQRLVLLRNQSGVVVDPHEKSRRGKSNFDRLTEFGLRLEEIRILKATEMKREQEYHQNYMKLPSRKRGLIYGGVKRSGGGLFITLFHNYIDQPTSLSCTMYEPRSSSLMILKTGLTNLARGLGGVFGGSTDWTPGLLRAAAIFALKRHCSAVFLADQRQEEDEKTAEENSDALRYWRANFFDYYVSGPYLPPSAKRHLGVFAAPGDKSLVRPGRTRRPWQLQQAQVKDLSHLISCPARCDIGNGTRLARGVSSVGGIRCLFSFWRCRLVGSPHHYSWILEVYNTERIVLILPHGSTGSNTYRLRLQTTDILGPQQLKLPADDDSRGWKELANKILKRCNWMRTPSSPELIQPILSEKDMSSDNRGSCCHLAFDKCIYKRALKVSCGGAVKPKYSRRVVVAVSQVHQRLIIRTYDPSRAFVEEVKRTEESHAMDASIIQQLSEIGSVEARALVIELLLSGLVLEERENRYVTVIRSDEEEEVSPLHIGNYEDLVESKTGEARSKAARRVEMASSNAARAKGDEKEKKKRERVERIKRLRGKGKAVEDEQLSESDDENSNNSNNSSNNSVLSK